MARALLSIAAAAAAAALVHAGPTCSFARNASGIECWGLSAAPSATTSDACAQACCDAGPSCQTWEFCPPGATCGTTTGPSCWIGAYSGCKPVSGWVGGAAALPLTMNLSVPQPPIAPVPLQGRPVHPSGLTFGANSLSLTLTAPAGGGPGGGGNWTQPYFPINGEMQFSRVNRKYWRRDLLRMKAGGLDTVGTYVFWIHHEEQQGQWNWAGNNDLRTFVTTAGEVGLKVFMRLGPWAHGECRNGGFPDWLVNMPGIQLRSLQPLYMGFVSALYSQIAAQLEGLFWYQGGPVVGAQVDNEYGGDASYLIALRDNATALGILPAYFTKTGWPSEPEPFGALLPLFGGYPDGFWDHSIQPNLPSYQAVYMFSRPNGDANTSPYPALMVEAGGGMETSYHRRVRIMPQDVAPAAAVFVGSGAASLGYYIYHGGTHPVGNLTTMEEQQLGYAGDNDMPVRNYDFYAPIGYQGQVHGHYHELRRLHLAMQAWGGWVGSLHQYDPDDVVTDPTDTTSLRWSARSDGTNGWLVLNQFQRNTTMSDVSNLTLTLTTAGGDTVQLPPNPAQTGVVTMKGGTTAILPLGMPVDLPLVTDAAATAPVSATAAAAGAAAQPVGPSFTVAYSYATPVTNLLQPTIASTVLVLAAVDGLPTEFAFTDPSSQLTVQSCTRGAVCTREDGRLVIRGAVPGSTINPITIGTPVLVLTNTTATPAATLSVLLLDWHASSRVYRGTLAGAARLFFTSDDNTTLYWDDAAPSSTGSSSGSHSATATATTASAGAATSSVLYVSYDSDSGHGAGNSLSFGVYPPPNTLTINGQPLLCNTAGLVSWCTLGPVPAPALTVTTQMVQPAGPARVVPIGPQKNAQAPNEDGGDDQWQAAAVYSVTLKASGASPGPLDPSVDIRLRLSWVGDAARVYPGPYIPGQRYGMNSILADCFYNTDYCEFPFTRLEDSDPGGGAAGALSNGLLLKLLPISAGVPIFLPSWPAFPPGTNSTLAFNGLTAVQSTEFAVVVA